MIYFYITKSYYIYIYYSYIHFVHPCLSEGEHITHPELFFIFKGFFFKRNKEKKDKKEERKEHRFGGIWKRRLNRHWGSEPLGFCNYDTNPSGGVFDVFSSFFYYMV